MSQIQPSASASNSISHQEIPYLKIPHTEPGIHRAITHRLLMHFAQVAPHQEIIVICIGTDRSTGDCLGPLVGTALSRLDQTHFHLFGTLDEPVHAVNLADTLRFIQEQFDNPYIIGIDACLGQTTSVGSIQVVQGPLRPGAGVNKQLPPVGDIHVTGIVNVGGFMEYFVLQNTRLSLVMKLSEIISNSIHTAITEWYRNAIPLVLREQ